MKDCYWKKTIFFGNGSSHTIWQLWGIRTHDFLILEAWPLLTAPSVQTFQAVKYHALTYGQILYFDIIQPRRT